MASNILIVENDTDFRKTLSERLMLRGYKIFEAQVIPEAEGMLKSHHFNASIVDVRMKDDNDTFDWSGLILARKIAGQDIPVIVLTAHDAPADVERAYSVAPGIKPPYAFISKNNPDYLEKVSEKLSEIATPPGGPIKWLKTNWEKLADIVLGILKRVFKLG